MEALAEAKRGPEGGPGGAGGEDGAARQVAARVAQAAGSMPSTQPDWLQGFVSQMMVELRKEVESVVDAKTAPLHEAISSVRKAQEEQALEIARVRALATRGGSAASSTRTSTGDGAGPGGK